MEIRKALTFRASSIGDCLMGKYFLEHIHAAYPNARCAIVVGSHGALIRDLCAAYPWLEVIEANRRNPFNILDVLWRWRGSDVVLTQYAGKRGGRFGTASKLVARLIARRGGLVGFTDTFSWNRHLYDVLISFDKKTAPAMLERRALATLGIPASWTIPTLIFNPNDVICGDLGLIPGRYVVAHLFAGNTGRGLSPKNQRELVMTLHRQMPDMPILISGGAQDRTQAEEAAKDIPHTHVIAGDVSLQDMMQLIALSAGVISVDTGIAHIAAHLRKPLVVLATCLGLHWWRKDQYGAQASVQLFTHQESNGHTTKEYPDCMNDIRMEEAAHALACIAV